MEGPFEIPFGGNAYVTKCCGGPEEINDNGLANWTESESVCSLMFHVHLDPEPSPTTVTTVTFDLALKLYVALDGQSVIRVALKEAPNQPEEEKQEYLIEISGAESHVVPVGKFRLPVGPDHPASCPPRLPPQHLVHLELQGILNSTGYFADVSHAIVSNVKVQGAPAGPAPAVKLSFVDSNFSFHFGRRGPSVHLNYVLPSEAAAPTSTSTRTEYFYNELLVPEGQDVVGSYFCAAGFHGGYFGIQVNSPTERRILFSIWSAFETDCPCEIPPELCVQLEKKGAGVQVQAFGCEGSGQQSILRYNWSAGTKYRFLVYGAPIPGTDSTLFRAWWSTCGGAPGEQPGGDDRHSWKLMASFIRPQTSTYLKSVYSFLENFDPDTGHVARKVLFMNQWAWARAAAEGAAAAGGEWRPITQAKFTGDDTSKECRKDYAGGLHQDDDGNGDGGGGEGGGSAFYLQNCGYFCERVNTGQIFCCGDPATTTTTNHVQRAQPDVNFNELP